MSKSNACSERGLTKNRIEHNRDITSEITSNNESAEIDLESKRRHLHICTLDT